MSKTRVDTLTREGICATNTRNQLFSGSGTGSRKGESVEIRHCDLLESNSWISLNNGWFQVSPMGSGCSRHCGAQTIVESSSTGMYICAYEPLTIHCSQACLSQTPEYNLEVAAKSMNRGGFEVIFALKPNQEFCSISCHVDKQVWIVRRTVCQTNTAHVLGEYSAVDTLPLKDNIFYSILLQVRENAVSIDINGVPICTSLKIGTASPNEISSTFNGLVGLGVSNVRVVYELLVCS